MTTLVHELTTAETRARLLGVTHVAWGVGFLAGTSMSGFLARDAHGGGAAFLVSGVCCAVAVPCALLVVRERTAPPPQS